MSASRDHADPSAASRPWRAIIRESGLPRGVQRHIRRVVRRAGLPRGAKARAATELVGRAASLVPTGSAAEHRPALGSVRAQARSIRREPWARGSRAWRIRSGVVRAGIRVMVFGGAALAVVYAGLLIRLIAAQPRVTRNLAAEWNAPLAGVPAGERAWPAYRETVLALERAPAEFGSKWPWVWSDDTQARAARAYLERNRAAIDRSLAATERRVLGFEVGAAPDLALETRSPGTPMPTVATGENRPVWEWTTEYARAMNELSKVWTAEALAAAERGDGERVAQVLLAMLRAASHASEHPVFVADVVANSLVINAGSVASHAAALPGGGGILSEERLAALQRAFEAAAAAGKPPRFGLERAWIADFAQRGFTDDGAGDGRITLMGLALSEGGIDQIIHPDVDPIVLGPVLALRSLSRREFLEQYERIESAAANDLSRPYWEVPDRWTSEEEYDRAHRRARWDFTMRVFQRIGPMPRKAFDIASHAEATRRGVIAGLAVERYRLREGRYPARLEDVVPEFLAELPRDWMDGEPIRYAVVEGRGRVYSIGPDYDDDGGRAPGPQNSGVMAPRLPPALAAQRQANEQKHPRPTGRIDCDWVIWPWTCPDGWVW